VSWLRWALRECVERITTAFPAYCSGSISVIGFVSDDGVCGLVFEQHVSADQIMGLPRREMEARRIAERIDRGVDLFAQPAWTTSDGLGRPSPFTPALFRRARMVVKTIRANSLSPSLASRSKTYCHTPVLLQPARRRDERISLAAQKIQWVEKRNDSPITG